MSIERALQLVAERADLALTPHELRARSVLIAGGDDPRLARSLAHDSPFPIRNRGQMVRSIPRRRKTT